MFKEVIGFMHYKDSNILEVGLTYKGKNDNYKVVEISDNFITIVPVNGYSNAPFQTYKSYLRA